MMPRDQDAKTAVPGPAPSLREILARLVAPESELRSGALASLQAISGYHQDPLAIYLLATRLNDPDLEIRSQAVRMLGDLLGPEGGPVLLEDRPLSYLVAHLDSFGKAEYIKLLEVSDRYLAAEESVELILQVCSYAGKSLSGILNDRKLPLSIRQQAIFFCGEVGFLDTAPSLRNLIQRIEKEKQRAAGLKSNQDQQALSVPAQAALAKLENRNPL